MKSGRLNEQKNGKGNTKNEIKESSIFWNINILLKKVSLVDALHNSILAEWIGTYLS